MKIACNLSACLFYHWHNWPQCVVQIKRDHNTSGTTSPDSLASASWSWRILQRSSIRPGWGPPYHIHIHAYIYIYIQIDSVSYLSTSINLFLSISISQYTSQHIYLIVSNSIYIYPYPSMSFYVYLCQLIIIYYLSVCLSVCYLSIYISVCLSVYLSICPILSYPIISHPSMCLLYLSILSL